MPVTTPGTTGTFSGISITYNATVTGVPSDQISISQTRNSYTTTNGANQFYIAPTNTPDPSTPAVLASNGSNPWLEQGSFQSTYGTGFTPTPSGAPVLNSPTISSTGGASSATFYDDPGFTPAANANYPVTQTQTFTTYVIDGPTNTTLAQQQWQITVIVNQNGTATVTYTKIK